MQAVLRLVEDGLRVRLEGRAVTIEVAPDVGDRLLDATALARLKSLLDLAESSGLVVDVTFTAEHIAGLSAAGYRAALATTTAALKSYRHVLFDLENERDLHGPGDVPMTAADIASAAAVVRAVRFPFVS